MQLLQLRFGGEHARNHQLPPFRRQLDDAALQRCRRSVVERFRPEQMPAEIEHRILDLGSGLEKRNAAVQTPVDFRRPGLVPGGRIELESEPVLLIDLLVGIILPDRCLEQLDPSRGIVSVKLANRYGHAVLGWSMFNVRPESGVFNQKDLVPATGFEPVRFYSLEPESSASANSATRARHSASISARGRCGKAPCALNTPPFPRGASQNRFAGAHLETPTGARAVPARNTSLGRGGLDRKSTRLT